MPYPTADLPVLHPIEHESDLLELLADITERVRSRQIVSLVGVVFTEDGRAMPCEAGPVKAAAACEALHEVTRTLAAEGAH